MGTSKFSGTFSKELGTFLTLPIKDLQAIGCSKIYLEYEKNAKRLFINAVNGAKTNYAIIDYTPEFIEEIVNFRSGGDLKFGIYDIAKLLNMFSVFTNGYELDITDDEVSIMHNKDVFNSPATDNNLDSLIETGPKTLKNDNSTTSFIWDSVAYKPINMAISKIDQDYISFYGNKGDKNIILSISNKDIRSNAFKRTIEVSEPVVENFKFVAHKNSISPIINSKNFQNMKVSIRKNTAICFHGSNEYYNITHIAPAVTN